MSRLTTSNLIRFSPGAGDGGDDESDPVSRFELSLATRLDGVTQWSTYSGAGLSATLTIAFEPILTSLCERLRLTGITAPGHADLSIPGAAYNDSTCAYSGPENSDPLTVYIDQDLATAVTGWTLKIHWQNQNWYRDFDWPGPIYTDDPPFGDDEQRPPALFKLKAFEAHTSRWVYDEDGHLAGVEDYGGVRIPMKLVIDPGMSRPYRVVKDLTGENCPVLTGGGTSITLKDGGPVFEVTMQEVADALTGLTDLYGSDDREGTYPLKWIVYKGDGDMVYEAECYTGASLGTYTDRRSGTRGLFETDSKDVARVTAIRAPHLVLHHNNGQRSGLYAATPPIRRTPALAGSDWWIGEVGGATTALSWNGADIYLGGRLLYRTSSTVHAAALRADTTTMADAPDDTPGTPCVTLIWVTGYSPLTIRRLTLAADNRTSTVLATGAPPEVDYQSSVRLAFSADATRLLYFLAPRFTVNGGYADSLINGRLYEAVMPSEDGGLLQWESRSESVQPTADGHFTWTDADNYAWGGAGELAVVAGARYVGNTLEPLVYRLSATVERARALTDFGVSLPPSDPPPSGDRWRVISGEYTYPSSGRFLRSTREASWTTLVTATPPLGAATALFDERSIDSVHRESQIEVDTLQWIQELADGTVNYATTVEYTLASSSWDTYETESDTTYRYRYAAIPRGGSGLALPLWATLGQVLSNGQADTYDRALTVTNGDQALISSQLAPLFTPTYFSDLGRFFRNPDPSSAEDAADCVRRCLLHAALLICDGGDENIAAVVCDSPSGTFAQLTDPSGARHIAIGGASINPSSLDAVWGGAPVTPYPCLWSAVKWPEIPRYTAPERPSVQDLLEAHNAIRKERGLSELTLNSDLSTAAALHGAWMEETGIFSHTGRDDSDPFDRARAAGYRGETQTSVGENLGGGYPTVAEMMLGWEGSPGHWANIIDPKWGEFGALIWPSSHWSPFVWVAVFGKRS